ncbi:unnamed protein product [Lupinus luteus]|uniref:Uncharacterized protein n=1 Tax=Lupinus luteus TaxID=3873 RepID=A0AAV1X9R0_LUPLU
MEKEPNIQGINEIFINLDVENRKDHTMVGVEQVNNISEDNAEMRTSELLEIKSVRKGKRNPTSIVNSTLETV